MFAKQKRSRYAQWEHCCRHLPGLFRYSEIPQHTGPFGSPFLETSSGKQLTGGNGVVLVLMDELVLGAIGPLGTRDFRRVTTYNVLQNLPRGLRAKLAKELGDSFWKAVFYKFHLKADFSSAWCIWSNYNDHPKWWFSKENLLFQGNLGWWNIIIWPDVWWSLVTSSLLPSLAASFVWCEQWPVDLGYLLYVGEKNYPLIQGL